MRRLLGLDLSPARCHLVRVRRQRSGSRVLAFHAVSANPADLAVTLRKLRTSGGLPRRARAVVWGLIGDRELVAGPDGADPTPAVAVEIARARLAPATDAGFSIELVTTPAQALAAIDAVRRPPPEGAARAYVALNVDGAAIAVVRAGRLLFARELDWQPPASVPQSANAALLQRYLLVSRLGPELHRACQAVQASFLCEIDQIVTCGSLPELRSLTMPLIEELDIEVETLDSLEGIDSRVLPAPADQFREQVAALRLAWAVAAARPAAVQIAHATRAPRGWLVGRLAAGAVGVLVVALVWYSGVLPTSRPDGEGQAVASRQDAQAVATPRPAARDEEPSERPARTAGAGERPEVPVAGVAAAESPAGRPEPGLPMGAGAAEEHEHLPMSLTESTPPAAEEAQGALQGTVLAVTEQASVASTPADPTSGEPPVAPADSAPPDTTPSHVAEAVPAPETSTREHARRTAVAESERLPRTDPAQRRTPGSPLPERRSRAVTPEPLVIGPEPPVVRSILISQGRRLAVVDGRIVGIGDQVAHATVVDIIPEAVILRDSAGRELRLFIQGPLDRVDR